VRAVLGASGFKKCEFQPRTSTLTLGVSSINAMNIEIIRQLEGQKGYPCVSVLLPTHRTHPDNKQDPIVLKNLLREAKERLLQEDTKRQAAPLLARLQELSDDVDHEHNLDGLGLFASADFSLGVRLPFAVRPRVQIDETFAVRDLVYAYNRTPHYWTLVLSEKPTRLFLCFRDVFEETKQGRFPVEHGGPGGASRLPGGVGVNPSAVRDAHRREFVRAVDDELAALLKIEDLPVAVTGTEDFLADFQAITAHSDRLLAAVPGSYDYASSHDLAEIVWPQAREGFALLRSRALVELDTAVPANLYASGVTQAWSAAKDGRVGLLLVEEDFHQPAILRPGQMPEPVADPDDPRAEDDLVDAAIQFTLNHGGRVVFADPGTLHAHERIAASLRY
jgi:hypothetical protein